MIIRMNGYEMAVIICTFDNFATCYISARIILSNNTFVNTVTKEKNVALAPYFRSTSRIYGVILPGPSSKVRAILRMLGLPFTIISFDIIDTCESFCLTFASFFTSDYPISTAPQHAGVEGSFRLI